MGVRDGEVRPRRIFDVISVKRRRSFLLRRQLFADLQLFTTPKTRTSFGTTCSVPVHFDILSNLH